ncbi:outer membrane protein TolC [Deinobacterium chartae]|uniref:Outer membrane protein TolC n=1 Tax=Deinobacterium chartae TaxID=521158 RepID=A0A841HZ94_9DEIO|nr:TolC family protein [Deinobacterium chartae]MBB6097212.1 outer membrane protein TolC [Deinobacterium chartae]
MKTAPLSALVLTVAVSMGAAQAQNYTLESALAKAENVSSVQLAALEVSDAQQNADRQLADPLLTRLGKVQATQRLALAKVKLDSTRRAAQAQIVSAYTGVLEAQEQVGLAIKSESLAERNVNIAQIRLRNGSGTQLDLRDAQRALEDARKSTATAKDALELAKTNLRNLIGSFTKLSEPEKLPTPPTAAVVESVLARSANLAQLTQAVELADVQRQLLDPAYSALAEIDAATSNWRSAQQNLADLRNSERLQVQNLFDQTLSAYKNVSVQDAAKNNALATLEVDRKRLQRGLISQVAFAQTEVRTLQAELAALQAKNLYLKNYYNLLSGGATGNSASSGALPQAPVVQPAETPALLQSPQNPQSPQQPGNGGTR